MATRWCIARATAEGGFVGRYGHWDGHPESVGKTLWDAYFGHFHGDLKAMLKFLIDDHPAGWSNISDAAWELPAGFGDANKGPHCYCHGERHEEANTITDQTAARTGCEYVYVFRSTPNGDIMKILKPMAPQWFRFTLGSGDPNARWNTIAVLALKNKDIQPNWAEVGR